MQKQYLVKKNEEPVKLDAPLTAAADSSHLLSLIPDRVEG
jgi:hypothetical protein